MFDSITRAPAGRWRRILLAFSGAVHGCAVTVLVAATMWRIDRLPLQRQPIAIAAPPMMSSPSSGGSPGKKMPPPPKAQPPRKMQVTHVQPVPVSVHEEQPASTSSDDTDGPPGTGPGNNEGPPGDGPACEPGVTCAPAAPLPCTDPSRAKDPDCAPPPPPQPPPVINADVVEGLRIAGETQIQPPEDVPTRMARSGEHRLRASFRVCLDTAGNVTGTTRTASTGYASYDDRLAAAIATWRYRPYSVGGTARAVCGSVTFVYTLR
jgi:hypothetical protein